MASKLHKSKEVEMKNYTSLELMYLLQDLLSEMVFRKQKVNNVQSKMDKELSSIYHAIEFNEYTTKDKREAFDGLKKHLHERRIAKNEAATVNNFYMIINANGIFPKLGQVIGQIQKDFHIESATKVYKQGEYNRFYEKNYLGKKIKKEVEDK